jgi:chromosome segregation ATPase
MASPVTSTPLISSSSSGQAKKALDFDKASRDPVEENALLRNEISLLTDEIASLTTKMRVNQESIPELRKQVAALEKRERQLVSEAKERQAREAEHSAKLQATETEVTNARRRIKELEASVTKLEHEKKLALQDMSFNNESQSGALITLQGWRHRNEEASSHYCR